MAGLCTAAGSSPYFCSKHAAEAFSSVLRTEMNPFGIQVITLNPSFHSTDLVTTMGQRLIALWEQVSPEVREDYGEDFFQHMHQFSVENLIRRSWDATVVENLLIESVELLHPSPQLIIGSFAKFGVLISRMLPTTIVQKILGAAIPYKTPAKMNQMKQKK